MGGLKPGSPEAGSYGARSFVLKVEVMLYGKMGWECDECVCVCVYATRGS